MADPAVGASSGRTVGPPWCSASRAGRPDEGGASPSRGRVSRSSVPAGHPRGDAVRRDSSTGSTAPVPLADASCVTLRCVTLTASHSHGGPVQGTEVVASQGGVGREPRRGPAVRRDHAAHPLRERPAEPPVSKRRRSRPPFDTTVRPPRARRTANRQSEFFAMSWSRRGLRSLFRRRTPARLVRFSTARISKSTFFLGNSTSSSIDKASRLAAGRFAAKMGRF